jgi:hypothetical protein
MPERHGEDDRVRQTNRARMLVAVPRCNAAMSAAATTGDRDDCIEDLIEAIADLDRDDIHQAAERLARVQDWIIRETDRAAADPVFAVRRLAS